MKKLYCIQIVGEVYAVADSEREAIRFISYEMSGDEFLGKEVRINVSEVSHYDNFIVDDVLDSYPWFIKDGKPVFNEETHITVRDVLGRLKARTLG